MKKPHREAHNFKLYIYRNLTYKVKFSEIGIPQGHGAYQIIMDQTLLTFVPWMSKKQKAQAGVQANSIPSKHILDGQCLIGERDQQYFGKKMNRK